MNTTAKRGISLLWRRPRQVTGTPEKVPATNLQLGDTVTFAMPNPAFGEQRRQGVIIAISDDGTVTAEFQQSEPTPMAITAPAENFTFVRTARNAAKVLDDIAFIVETANDDSLRGSLRSLLRKSGFGQAGRDLALGAGTESPDEG